MQNKDYLNPDHAKPILYDSFSRSIFLCGPHGVGKSTLLSSLLPLTSASSISRVDFEFTPKTPYERAAMRLMKYHVETMRHIERTASDRNNWFIGDRCAVDTLVYCLAYLRLNWITQEQYERLMEFYLSLFKNLPFVFHVIILQASPEWIKGRLVQRWHKSEMGWMEDNDQYLNTVCQAYLDFNYTTLENVQVKIRLNMTSLQERITATLPLFS